MPKSNYLNSLTPAKRTAAKQLKAMLRKPSHELKWRLKVGRLVNRLAPSSSSKRYGQMTGLLSFLDKPLYFQAELYAARKAAACYPPSALPELKDLSWGHVKRLLMAPEEERSEFQKQCLADEWSCDRLSREIRKKLGARGHGGRLIKEPENFGPAVSLREMTRLAKRWAICHSAWFDASGERLAGLRSATSAKALQRDLEAAAEQLAEVRKLVSSALKAVRSHLAELQTKSAQKKPARRGMRKSSS